MNFLALITNNYIWILYSLLIKYILVFFYKFKIGKNFFIKGTPNLRLTGSEYIAIGNDVKILGNIDLRTREKGKITIDNNVKIEENCRFVAAKNGFIYLGEGTVVGANAIWNGGGDIKIGKNCIFSARTSINANEHDFAKQNKNSNLNLHFNYGDVMIEDECFFGVNTSVALNTKIEKGAVIGAHSFVNTNLEPFSINAGCPAKKIRSR